MIAELTEDYESKLADEALKMEQLQTEKTELEREFEEIKRQLEEDADRCVWGEAAERDGTQTGVCYGSRGGQHARRQPGVHVLAYSFCDHLLS